MSQRFIALIAFFAAALLLVTACDDDDQPAEQGEAEQQLDDADEQSDEEPEAAAEPTEQGATMTITWDFISDQPLEDAPADAWARIGGIDGDQLEIFVASPQLDGVCDEDNAIGALGNEVEEGQFALNFSSHDMLSDDEKKPFDGQPATFDAASITAYYYSEMSEQGTNTGWSADSEDYEVTIDVTDVTDDFIVGTASAPRDADSDISAEFTARLCD